MQLPTLFYTRTRLWRSVEFFIVPFRNFFSFFRYVSLPTWDYWGCGLKINRSIAKSRNNFIYFSLSLQKRENRQSEKSRKGISLSLFLYSRVCMLHFRWRKSYQLYTFGPHQQLAFTWPNLFLPSALNHPFV